jgi:hypothetical protein
MPLQVPQFSFQGNGGISATITSEWVYLLFYFISFLSLMIQQVNYCTCHKITFVNLRSSSLNICSLPSSDLITKLQVLLRSGCSLS